MTNSIYKIASFGTLPGVPAGTPLLPNDVLITPEMVSPGGGGLVRLYFSIVTVGNVVTEIGVLDKDGFIKGTLNGDNNNNINSNSYYRFDIDIEALDTINLITTEAVQSVVFFRAHLITFGA